jgi:hypothetical protein
VDPINIIVMALVTDAAAALKPTTEQAVKDAYVVTPISASPSEELEAPEKPFTAIYRFPLGGLEGFVNLPLTKEPLCGIIHDFVTWRLLYLLVSRSMLAYG